LKINRGCFAALGLGMLLLQGCASIVSGTNQVVSVETPGCPASACELTNDKGKWYVNATPGTTTVNRAYGDLTAFCKNGEVTATVAFKSTTKGMAFGNILLGGAIGVGVDVASGAAYDYPQTLVVPMSCAPAKVAAVADTSRRLKLGIKGENLTAATAAAAGQSTTDGVLVTAVEEGSLGNTLGFKVGHIVSEMNGKRIADIDAFSSGLTNADEGDVEFVVYESGKPLKLGRRKGSL
jgi:hypothetical protein